MSRIHDSELKIPSDQDALTTPELFEHLQKAIFAEMTSLKPGEYSNRKPAISSLRRNLQRIYLRKLSNLALGNTSAPDDCQTVAYYQLVSLQGQIKDVLSKKDLKLDTYSVAHLQETSERISKVLESRLALSQP